ncbi:MAG: hypothetical protein P1P64_00950 [Treponemataceae bacterium]
MTTLNRIERNFIFENFARDLPIIRLILQNGKVVKILGSEYQLDNNFVEMSDLNIKEQICTLLFPHKNRLISANVEIQRKGVRTFFLFPEKLMLYENKETKDIHSKIILQINKKAENGKLELVKKELNLQLLEKFPLFDFTTDLLLEQKNNSLLTNVNLMLSYQNNKLKDEFCISRLYFFLEELANGNILEFEKSNTTAFLSLLFVSDKCAVFFMQANLQKLISLSIEKTLQIKVGRRFMSLPLSKIAGVMSLSKTERLNQDMALVAISTENIAIEDKRFLHEKLYAKKFGEL